MKHSGLWIVQLYIHYVDNDEIQATLASIPYIYRTLEVVATMLGGKYSCLRQGYERLITMEPDAPTEDIVELSRAQFGCAMT